MRPEPTRLRRALAAELALLRRVSGLSGRDLATHLNVSQATVSRAEAGTAVLSRPQADAWLTAVAAEVAARERVLALVDAAHAESLPWRSSLPSSGHFQGVAADLEQVSGLICNYSPTVIPGLLQTPEYVRALLPLFGTTGREDHVASLAARMERQAVLYTERTFRFIIGHQALSWSPAGDNLMAAQRDRLRQIDREPNVEVTLLDERAAGPPAWSNFVIYDEPREPDIQPVVALELAHGRTTISDSDDVALYRELFARLAASAVPADGDHCKRS